MNLFILAGLLVLMGLVIAAVREFESLTGGNQDSRKYRYTRKKYLLTRTEYKFYAALVDAAGDRYRVFTQVHLPTILDHTVAGQNWKGALSHINRKSVDFVLCEPQYLSPRLAIELDDRSHELPDRQKRDIEVERILAEAGIPLLRIKTQVSYDSSEIAQKIAALTREN